LLFPASLVFPASLLFPASLVFPPALIIAAGLVIALLGAIWLPVTVRLLRAAMPRPGRPGTSLRPVCLPLRAR
jgi:hypothetical protein